MAWHEQREVVEQLAMHGELEELFGTDDAAGEGLDNLAAAGFTVNRASSGDDLDGL